MRDEGRAYIVAVTQRKTLLRRLRRERELTLDELALATGINVSTLSRAERGLMDLTDDNQSRLEAYFGRPAQELLREVA